MGPGQARTDARQQPHDDLLRLGQVGDRHQTRRLMPASPGAGRPVTSGPGAGRPVTSGPGAGRPATSGSRVAITAGSLAVLLGALDTYVVVTIMTDIMKDVGIGINQIQ